MARRARTDLSRILRGFTSHVYFQPPTGTLLEYPCIIYKLSDIEAFHADNILYDLNSKYEVTYITRDPDDENRYNIAMLPMCSFDRSFVSDNLNHYVYTLYY